MRTLLEQMCAGVRILQRKRTNKGVCVYVEKETEGDLLHCKELAHVIGEAGKSRVDRVGWQVGDLEKS